MSEFVDVILAILVIFFIQGMVLFLLFPPKSEDDEQPEHKEPAEEESGINIMPMAALWYTGWMRNGR